MMMKSFEELLKGICGSPVSNNLLAFDPGETTGWAHFLNGTLHKAGEEPVPVEGEVLHGEGIGALMELYQPDTVVIEDYKIYASKAKPHTWNALYTPKLIGFIQAHAKRYTSDIVMQMASSKQFCTNDKLKAWGFYPKGNPHAADAVRHGCYFLLFHKRKRG